MNDAYRRARLDILYACDEAWWNHYDGVPGFAGIKATQAERPARRFGLRWLKLEGQKGLNKKPGHISSGGNSGHQALNLAYHTGASRILLLGYDMGGKHWFHDRPGIFNKNSPFSAWVKDFEFIARDLEAQGVEVINCSLNSALRCFKKIELADCI